MCLLNDKSGVKKLARLSYLEDIMWVRDNSPTWTLPSLVWSDDVIEERETSVRIFKGLRVKCGPHESTVRKKVDEMSIYSRWYPLPFLDSIDSDLREFINSLGAELQ